ncbi:hypothetical protein ABJW09_003152 [Escherichia albertii]
MNLLCDRCKKKFIASEEQEKFISDSRSKGMKFIMIKCPHCSMSYPFNPMSSNTPSPTEQPVGDGLRCPKETCSGIVSYIDDVPSFWGCGECGNVWFKKNDLYSDIKNIINILIEVAHIKLLMTNISPRQMKISQHLMMNK